MKNKYTVEDEGGKLYDSHSCGILEIQYLFFLFETKTWVAYQNELLEWTFKAN